MPAIATAAWSIAKAVADAFPEPPAYVRLHGTPKIYYSSSDEAEIGRYRRMLADGG